MHACTTVGQLLEILQKSDPKMKLVVRQGRSTECRTIVAVDIGALNADGSAYRHSQHPDKETTDTLAIQLFT